MSRISDMLCTCHAKLAERLNRRAFLMDMLILALSTWLAVTAFVPAGVIDITPLSLEPLIWAGSLGTFTFFLTILQMKLGWKERSDSHKRSSEMYAEVKSETRQALASQQLSSEIYDVVSAKYNFVSKLGSPIPENTFLMLKAHHLKKIQLSKVLDKKPHTNLLLYRCKAFLEENWRA